MKRENAIEVDNITKSFKIYYDRGHTLKEALFFRKRNQFDMNKVIDGISFCVPKGDAIGLIGHNGCGKSTTLKMLTKIMFPDSGRIIMNGRVSSLIELGAGFHPEMTGRENIYINASIFGLTKKEINSRIEDIIAFSELEEYIDNPVRTYSSGMYMRLAFSVAINVDADILLIDEILAVGDAGFQAKCFNRLKEIKAQGTTIVIVSHSLGQIEQICETSIWIHEGKIKAKGEPREVHPMYLEYVAKKQQEMQNKEDERKKQDEHDCSIHKKEDELKENIIKTIAIKHFDNDSDCTSFTTGEPVKIIIEYNSESIINDINIEFSIFRSDGLTCFRTSTIDEHMDAITLHGQGSVEIIMPSLELLSGNYTIDIALENTNGIMLEHHKEASKFSMINCNSATGVSDIKHEWNFIKTV